MEGSVQMGHRRKNQVPFFILILDLLQRCRIL